MASGPITSWQIDGEIMKTVRHFIWGGSKITADSDCSHGLLLPGRKAMSNLGSILKSRYITLPIKVSLVKAMVFPGLLPSHFSRVRLLATPGTVAYQAPSPTGFSRQKYWSGLPLPSPIAMWKSAEVTKLAIWRNAKRQDG